MLPGKQVLFSNQRCLDSTAQKYDGKLQIKKEKAVWSRKTIKM